MQPKKIIRLTEAEKKIISEYSAYTAYTNARHNAADSAIE